MLLEMCGISWLLWRALVLQSRNDLPLLGWRPVRRGHYPIGMDSAQRGRNAPRDQILTPEAGAHAGHVRLVGQVQATVMQLGDPGGFDASEWLALWLHRPLTALGGRRPVELLNTGSGRATLSSLLARMLDFLNRIEHCVYT